MVANLKIDLKRDNYLHPYPAEPSIRFCLYCGSGWRNEGDTACPSCKSIEHYVLDKNKVNRKRLDFPTAFAIARNAELSHDPKCSEVQTDGALLCDCGAVQNEHNRLMKEVA